jgi:hypothetical protein
VFGSTFARRNEHRVTKRGRKTRLLNSPTIQWSDQSMEARLIRAALVAAAFLSLGASHRTQNFIVTASTPQLAQEICDSAEAFRRNLAIEWLAAELPPWNEPCPITANVSPQLGAGGATSFMFDRGRPFGWTMTIQGSRERVLDSVLPHEITHTIFATHFGRPLPRWADEGACTTVEHVSERTKQQQMLVTFLTTGRGIAFNQMFAMKEYPPDVMPLYSQGYSLARYLIAQGGKPKFVEYVGDGMNWNNWTAATKKHYGFNSLSDLQVTWLDWVRQGSQPLQDKTLLVSQPPIGNNLVAVAPYNAAQQQLAANDSPKGVPAMTVSANSENGWYARQRDLALARRDETTSSNAAVSRGFASIERPSSSPSTSESSVMQQSTRPQPIGRPEQVILEWARPAASSPAPATPIANPLATPNSSPSSYYAAPPRQPGTLWR